jgi:hypothetical protein
MFDDFSFPAFSFIQREASPDPRLAITFLLALMIVTVHTAKKRWKNGAE